VRIETCGRTVVARAVVVTAGAWARSLVAQLGIDLRVVATRETVTHFRLPDALELPTVIDDIAPEAGSPGLERPGEITYALASPRIGLKVGLHHAGPPTDPNEDGAVSEGVVRWASQWVARRYPEADSSPAAAETCLYTNTADERFVLERHGRVVVGSACSGHGFKFAPALGRTLAALAAEAAG
jgi:sarcosine oxidase